MRCRRLKVEVFKIQWKQRCVKKEARGGQRVEVIRTETHTKIKIKTKIKKLGIMIYD